MLVVAMIISQPPTSPKRPRITTTSLLHFISTTMTSVKPIKDIGQENEQFTIDASRSKESDDIGQLVREQENIRAFASGSPLQGKNWQEVGHSEGLTPAIDTENSEIVLSDQSDSTDAAGLLSTAPTVETRDREEGNESTGLCSACGSHIRQSEEKSAQEALDRAALLAVDIAIEQWKEASDCSSCRRGSGVEAESGGQLLNELELVSVDEAEGRERSAIGDNGETATTIIRGGENNPIIDSSNPQYLKNLDWRMPWYHELSSYKVEDLEKAEKLINNFDATKNDVCDLEEARNTIEKFNQMIKDVNCEYERSRPMFPDCLPAPGATEFSPEIKRALAKKYLEYYPGRGLTMEGAMSMAQDTLNDIHHRYLEYHSDLQGDPDCDIEDESSCVITYLGIRDIWEREMGIVPDTIGGGLEFE